MSAGVSNRLLHFHHPMKVILFTHVCFLQQAKPAVEFNVSPANCFFSINVTFMSATWDYISQLSTTKQNPIRCYYITAGDITLSSLGRWGRTGSARRGGGGRSARLVYGRLVQLHSLLSASALGGTKLLQNNHIKVGVLLNKGGWPSRFGTCRKDRKEAKWHCMFSNACVGPGAKTTNR